jgi:hypothetical protein
VSTSDALANNLHLTTLLTLDARNSLHFMRRMGGRFPIASAS